MTDATGDRQQMFQRAVREAEEALRSGKIAEAIALALELRRQRPNAWGALRVGLWAHADLGHATTVLRLLDEAQDLMPEEAFAPLLLRTLARCGTSGWFELGLEAARRFRPPAMPRHEALAALLDCGVKRRHEARFKAEIEAMRDRAAAASLLARLAVRQIDLPEAERLLRLVPPRHPARAAAASEAFRLADRLHDDAAIGRLCREVDHAATDAAGLHHHRLIMCAEAQRGQFAAAREAHARLVTAMEAVRADPASFALHWRRIARIRASLFEIAEACTDVERAHREGSPGSDALHGHERFLRFHEEFAAELAWSRQAFLDLLHGRPVTFPRNELVRIVSPDPKLINAGLEQPLGADLNWLAVVEATMRQARGVGRVACLLPDYLEAAAARCRPAPMTLSYHTVGARGGHVHFKEADMMAYASIDRAGYAGWSRLAEAGLDSMQLDRVPPAHADRFWRELRDKMLTQNISKYAQPERRAAGAGPGSPYVFVALQVLTDRTQRLARVPMLEMLRIVARRFAAGRVAVLVKRHPRCRDALVADLLEELVAAGQIELRDDSIHDLIEGAEAVVTVNSGVGSEALMHLKPVYLFGKADYAAACHHVDSEAQFRTLTSPIRHPVPVEIIKRFLFHYRNRFLVDVENPDRLAEAVRNRVIGPALQRAQRLLAETGEDVAA